MASNTTLDIVLISYTLAFSRFCSSEGYPPALHCMNAFKALEMLFHLPCISALRFQDINSVI